MQCCCSGFTCVHVCHPRLLYRQVHDAQTLTELSDVIADAFASRGLFAFSATWGFIATYHQVAPFGASALPNPEAVSAP